MKINDEKAKNGINWTVSTLLNFFRKIVLFVHLLKEMNMIFQKKKIPLCTVSKVWRIIRIV